MTDAEKALAAAQKVAAEFMAARETLKQRIAEAEGQRHFVTAATLKADLLRLDQPAKPGEAERLAQLHEQFTAAEARGDYLTALNLKAEYLKGL